MGRNSKLEIRNSGEGSAAARRTASVALPQEVREVADALIDALGDELQALLWHGSWARGEATAESDHDLIVVVKRLDEGLLLRVREVFRQREKWSTFVQTVEEVRQYPLHGRLQFHFGCVPLYGSIEAPAWNKETLLEDLRSLALEIRFTARYRLLHKQHDYSGMDEQQEAFLRGRTAAMFGYATKWALLAMKSREMLEGRPYPATRAELRERLSDPLEIELVETLEHWPEVVGEVRMDPAPLALKLDAFARRLVERLPAPRPVRNSKLETQGGPATPGPRRRNSKLETRNSGEGSGARRRGGTGSKRGGRVSNREFRVSEGSPE